MIIMSFMLAAAMGSVPSSPIDTALEKIKQEQPHLFEAKAPASRNAFYKAMSSDIIIALAALAILETYHTQYLQKSEGILKTLITYCIPTGVYRYSQHSLFIGQCAFIALEGYITQKIVHWIMDKTIS